MTQVIYYVVDTVFKQLYNIMRKLGLFRATTLILKASCFTPKSSISLSAYYLYDNTAAPLYRQQGMTPTLGAGQYSRFFLSLFFSFVQAL